MAITSGLSVGAKRSFLRGEFLAGDTYKLALYDSSANLSLFDSVYKSAGEVIGQGYQKGGVILEGYECELDGTTACITWKVSPQWKNATINARGAVIYNASKGNKTLLILDFGKDVISTNGNWTFPMPSLTETEALIRFG
jgi:hypothetical protein